MPPNVKKKKKQKKSKVSSALEPAPSVQVFLQLPLNLLTKMLFIFWYLSGFLIFMTSSNFLLILLTINRC